MTTVATAISDTKIKMRWREQYVTEGVNKALLAMPRGFLRGYWLDDSPSPDQYLHLRIDPLGTGAEVDQTMVFGQRETYGGVAPFAAVLRETADVQLDCSAFLPAVSTMLYVYVLIDYAPNATTVANYYVSDEDPHQAASANYNPWAHMVGRFVANGATISFDPSLAAWQATAYDPSGTYRGRTVPKTSAAKTVWDLGAWDEAFGLLDCATKYLVDEKPLAEPTVEGFSGLVAVTKVQLTGDYYVGLGGGGTATHYFEFRNSDGHSTLLASDGHMIKTGTIYLSDGTTPCIPSTHADAAGFVTDPYVGLSFLYTTDVSYSGALSILCGKKASLLELSEEPSYALPVALRKLQEHWDDHVFAGASGSPDSMLPSYGGAAITTLLGLVNERIQSQYSLATTGWVELWRSSTAAHTKDTLSIWFMDGQIAILKGGYLGGAAPWYTVTAGSGAGADNVWMWLISNTAAGRFVKQAPAAASSWAALAPAGWDDYAYENASGQSASTLQHYLTGDDARIHGDDAGAPLNDWLVLFQGHTADEVTNPPAVIMYHTSGEIMMAWNMGWNSSDGKFYALNNAHDAVALRLGRISDVAPVSQEGIAFCRKSASDSISSGWFNDVASGATWTSVHQVASKAFDSLDAKDAHGGMAATGQLYEEHAVVLSAVSDSVVAFQGGAVASQGINFRSRWTNYPNTVTFATDDSLNWTGTPYVHDGGTHIDNGGLTTGPIPDTRNSWGFHVTGWSSNAAWSTTEWRYWAGRVKVGYN